MSILPSIEGCTDVTLCSIIFNVIKRKTWILHASKTIFVFDISNYKIADCDKVMCKVFFVKVKKVMLWLVVYKATVKGNNGSKQCIGVTGNLSKDRYDHLGPYAQKS